MKREITLYPRNNSMQRTQLQVNRFFDRYGYAVCVNMHEAVIYLLEFSCKNSDKKSMWLIAVFSILSSFYFLADNAYKHGYG